MRKIFQVLGFKAVPEQLIWIMRNSRPLPPPRALSFPSPAAFNYLISPPYTQHLKAKRLKYKSPPNHYVQDLSALFRAVGCE